MKKITLIVLLLFITLTGYAQTSFSIGEGFEASTPSGNTWSLSTGVWKIENVGGPAKTWVRSTEGFTSTPPHSGTFAAYLDKENVAPGATIPEDWLITPQINLAGMSTPELRFYAKTILTGVQGSEYKVMISTTSQNMATFSPLKTWTESEMNPSPATYNELVVDLSSYAGGNIYLAFVMIGKDKDRWLIDDVVVGDKCFPVSLLSATAVTTNSATLAWNSPSGVSQWEVEVINDLGTPTGTGSITSISNNYTVSATTSGIPFQPGSSYRYFVRSVCGGNRSTWTGPFVFTTQTAGASCSTPIVIPSTLPYVSINNNYKHNNYFSTYPGTGCGLGSTEFVGAVYTTYSYTATNNGNLNISFNPNENSAAIFIYGSCADIGVNCLAGSANTSELTKYIKNFPLSQGSTYYIVVASKSKTTQAHYSLILSINNGCSPLAASFTIDSNCTPNSTFNATANITEMGGGTSVLATLYKNGIADASQLIGNPGPITFNSIGANDVVSILLQSNQNHNCLLLSNELSKELCPPLNDDCANAIVIEPSIQGYCNSTKGKLSGATASPELSSCPGNENDDVWYQFTALGDTHVISIMDINGNDVNLNHAVYEGSACGNLVQLYCDEDNHSIANNLVAGQTYKIRVYSDATTPANTTFEICTIGFPYTCIDTNPRSATVKNLFKDLINYLLSLQGPHTQPFECSQLTALAPYISDPSPKIYNFENNPQLGAISFSFSEGATSSDVVVYRPSGQAATDINFYTYISPEHQETFFVTYGDGSTHDKGNLVRHINFCPPPQCPPVEGYIKVTPGMSCMVAGVPSGFSLITSVEDIESYAWAFYDAQMQIVGTSTLKSPVFKFDTVGTYTAKVMVTQTDGCKTYIEKLFTVRTTCSDICTENSSQTAQVKSLYIDFINYLFDYLEQGNTIPNNPNGFTCPKLAALSPFLVNNYNKIYNVSYTGGTLSFSFWEGGAASVSVKNNGHITDIDLTGFTDAYTGAYYPTKYVNNSTYSNYISLVYFCPLTACPPANGFIGLSQGMSCVATNKAVGLKFDSDISGITAYNWTTSGGVISGANTATPTLTSGQFAANYTITLQITYGSGCTATFYKTLYVGSTTCTTCTETNPDSTKVKKLYIDLINYLITFGPNVPTTPFTCPQLEALAPYITDDNPMIWNMNYNGSNLRFSFSNHGTEYDVSTNAAYGAIADIDLLNYTSFAVANNINVRHKSSSQSGHSVRHVDFCPPPSECNNQMTGVIKLANGQSCVPLNIEQEFSLQTPFAGEKKYEWTFYNTNGTVLTTSKDAKPKMTYNTTGNFLVKLVVTDDTGCESIFYKTITVSISCGDFCTETNEESANVSEIFKILLNKLFNVGTALTNGYSCPELLDLAPYITDANPAIYNPVLTNNGLTLSFSFSPGDTHPDVVISKLGTVQDINLVNFVAPTLPSNFTTTSRRGAQAFTNSVKHINFCPPVEPCESHVAFVVDESSSIDETEASDIRVQLQQFVNQQKDSGMTVSLIGMSDSDEDTRRDHLTAKIDASTIDAFTNWITNYKKGYSATDIALGNSPDSDYWASGLKRAYYSDLKPEMIIMFTDGSKTANTTKLKHLMQTINNDPETHLYIYGIGEGSYVDGESNFDQVLFKSTMETPGQWPEVTNYPSNGTVVLDTSEKYIGSYSLKLSTPQGSPFSYVHSNVIVDIDNAQQMTTYTVSGWVKSPQAIARIYLFMKEAGQNGIGEYKHLAFIDSQIKPGWQYLELDVNVPIYIKKLNFRVDNYGAGDVWFDNLQIVKKGTTILDTNSGEYFETIFEDDMETPYKWPGILNHPGYGAVVFDTNEKHSGDKSLKMSTPADSPQGVSLLHSTVYTPVNNDAETLYTISGWVKSPQAEARMWVFMRVAGMPHADDYVKVDFVGSQVKPGWQYIEKTVSVPDSIKELNVRLDNLGLGDAWFDDIKIQKKGIVPVNSPYDQDVYTNNMEDSTTFPPTAIYPGGAPVVFDNARSHSGEYSLRLTTPPKSAYPEYPEYSEVAFVHANQYINIHNEANTQYVYSGWIYTENSPGQLTLFMNTDTETTYFTTVASVASTKTMEWQYVEGTFNVPADIRWLNLRLDHYGVGDVWFDDIKIVKKSVNTNINNYNQTVFESTLETIGDWPSTATYPAGQPIVNYDTTHVRNGTKSLKVHGDGSTPEVYVYSDKTIQINNVQDTEYTYSAWVYNETQASPEMFLFMYTVLGVQTWDRTWVAPVQGSGWQYFEKTIVVPANIRSLRLRLDNNGVGDVWFDDINIVRKPVGNPTSTVPGNNNDEPVEVTTRLMTSIKYLLDLPPAVFPVSDNVDLLEGIYYEYESFANLSNPNYERYFSNKLAEAGVGCEGVSIPLDYCADCETFQPIPGNAYWISGWVKEENNIQVKEYLNGVVNLIFVDGGKHRLGSMSLQPSGDIIDGWQRVAAKFIIPENTAMLDIELENLSASIPVYFDDIRIHPFKGSMKSFVYDPETFRLMAEQDDNNYSTFYEYDKEGGLIRIKKETSKGIKTIQESRSGSVIKPSN